MLTVGPKAQLALCEEVQLPSGEQQKGMRYDLSYDLMGVDSNQCWSKAFRDDHFFWGGGGGGLQGSYDVKVCLTFVSRLVMN